MIIILSGAAYFLLSLLLIFTDLPMVKATFIGFSGYLFIYSLILRRRERVNFQSVRAGEESSENILNENIRISLRLKETEALYQILLSKSDAGDFKNEQLIEDASYLCTALPLMKKMATLIIDKTEESALNLTENIFQISNKSSKVGNHINLFLNDMFSGEKSLKKNIDTLNGEMKRIEKLIEDFSSIKNRYTVDMKHIEENVQVINSYLTGIRDVSDRTGLLAINSSIEAARVGVAGKGFSVLAGEIQGLATSSKNISLKIDGIVETISHTVEDSFDTLGSEISLSLSELSQTQRDLQEISTNLNDKVSNVEEHVKNSDSLSKTVTEQLNKVSVNMQYQDITRQILEHIISTLSYYRVNLEEKEPEIIARSDLSEKKVKVIEKASTYFTIVDEWKLFGLDSLITGSKKENMKEEFKGNVEMF